MVSLFLSATISPAFFIDLKYATTDNFTGRVIYDSDEAYLRYGTVKKLLCAQNELSGRGA